MNGYYCHEYPGEEPIGPCECGTCELNEVTWLVVDELTLDWEELRERWKIVVTPSGADGSKERREARMVSPAELETETWARYGFDDLDSYYANGQGFIDSLQKVALRTAIESVDWARVIEQLEKGRETCIDCGGATDWRAGMSESLYGRVCPDCYDN